MVYKKWRYPIYMLIVIYLLMVFPIITSAQEIPSGMLIGDDQGITVKKDGEYLIEINDVMPGKKWHTTVSMVNMEKGTPYQLSMLISPPEVSGSLDLSKAIEMRLTYEEKVVYEGPVSGVSDAQSLQTTPLNLGIFNAGDSRALEVDLSISGDYTNKEFSKKNSMENRWTFYAEKSTEPSPSTENPSTPSISTVKPVGRFPSTGEIQQGMIFMCLGLFLLLLALLLLKERKRRSTKKKM